MSDFINSLIRTIVPMAVGWLATTLLLVGIELDPDTQAQLIAAMTSILSAAYYALIRFLEGKYPWVGWLLGKASPPAYQGKHLA